MGYIPTIHNTIIYFVYFVQKSRVRCKLRAAIAIFYVNVEK